MVADVVDQLTNLNVWQRGDERAPHKPLLLLYAIAQYLRGHDRLIPFREVDGPLRQLLIDFGPARTAYHPELPFWHLQSDGVWELNGLCKPDGRVGSTSIKKSLLVRNDVHGGLTLPLYQAVQDPKVASRVIEALLTNTFPETYHDDILVALALDPGCTVTRTRRDPAFREIILRAYEFRCAVCGFSSRVGQVLVGVEAAHIKWHQAGGPDKNENGVALCSLHHKLFDRGLFTITPDMRVLVSECATGSAIFKHLVLDFHGRDLSHPVRTEYAPLEAFLEWHVAEVFHPPGRELRAG